MDDELKRGVLEGDVDVMRLWKLYEEQEAKVGAFQQALIGAVRMLPGCGDLLFNEVTTNHAQQLGDLFRKIVIATALRIAPEKTAPVQDRTLGRADVVLLLRGRATWIEEHKRKNASILGDAAAATAMRELADEIEAQL